MAWKVEYTKAAREQLKKLPREVSLRVTKYMEERAALLPREYGKAMIGDLAYYMSLPYEVRVQELSEDDGGGIMLSVPLLGEAAVRGYGETYPTNTKLGSW